MRIETIKMQIADGSYPTRAQIRQAADRIITSYQDGYERGRWDGWRQAEPRKFGQAISPMAEGYLAGYERGRQDRQEMGVTG